MAPRRSRSARLRAGGHLAPNSRQLAAHCDDHLARWPGHRRRVEDWKRAIRRYVFWALAFEVGLQYRQRAGDGAGPRRDATLFELRGYRLDPAVLRRAVDRLWNSRSGGVDTLACLAITALIRIRLPGLFTWATHHVSTFRRLLRLQ